MDSIKRDARMAGLLYLLVVLTGPFVLIYVPGRIFVPASASATAGNILAHQGLFRTYLVVEFIAELAFVATALALYRLLKAVGPSLAAIMVILVLIDAPMAFLGIANQVATLTLLRGANFLSVFDKPQRDTLAMLLVNFDRHGALVAEVFWGLWLLPLAVLVYRSRFLPRFLGVWLSANGIAYLAISATGLFSPGSAGRVSTLSTPVLFGEVAFTLWLLIVGARGQARAAAA